MQTQKSRMQSDDCYKGFWEVHSRTLGASFRRLTTWESREDSRQKRNRWDKFAGTLVAKGTGRGRWQTRGGKDRLLATI